MSGTYLFIDGNYLELRYAERMRAFFGDDGDLDYASVRGHVAQDLQRVFYYNSIDYGRRKDEDERAAAARITEAEARLDAIEAVRDIHVRPGTVTTAARRRRGQKKVDILLAVDMLTHAQSRNMEKAILIAGDLDFAPLLAAVTRLGIRVGVFFDPGSVSKELLEEADFAEPMNLRRYFAWSSPEYRKVHAVPNDHSRRGEDFRASQPGSVELGAGRLAALPVALLQLPNSNTFAVAIRDEARETNAVITDGDLTRLLRYIALEYPEIRWNASPLSWLLNGSAMVVSFRYVQHSIRESGETQQATGA